MSVFTTLAVTEDGFAFDTCTGESYTLNSCGRLVLKRLQQGENRQQIANFLSSEFAIAQSSAERDVSDFFQQLNTFGLTGVNR
jgi:hypothetical protein